MSDQDKVLAIMAELSKDEPQTATGKIMKAVLLTTIPQLQAAQLDQVMAALGLTNETT